METIIKKKKKGNSEDLLIQEFENDYDELLWRYTAGDSETDKAEKIGIITEQISSVQQRLFKNVVISKALKISLIRLLERLEEKKKVLDKSFEKIEEKSAWHLQQKFDSGSSIYSEIPQ